GVVIEWRRPSGRQQPRARQRPVLHALEWAARLRMTGAWKGAAMAESRPWVVDPNEVVEYERLTPPTRVSSLVANDICGAQHVAAGMFKLKGREVSKRDIHDEEELYYVVSGRAKIEMGGETFFVQPGMV